MKKISWIFLYPLAIIMIVLAVSNREPVEIDLWPMPLMVGIPLYLLMFGTLVAGVIWGGMVAWMSGGRIRKTSRGQAREIRVAESEIKGLKDQVAKLEQEPRPRPASTQNSLTTNTPDKKAALLPPTAI